MLLKCLWKNLKRNGNGHLVKKNNDNHILYSVIWVNISEKLTFYNIYEIQWKLTPKHACHKIVRKNTCMFYRKIRVLKELQCMYFEKADPW